MAAIYNPVFIYNTTVNCVPRSVAYAPPGSTEHMRTSASVWLCPEEKSRAIYKRNPSVANCL